MEYVLGLAQCTQPADGRILDMVRNYFEDAQRLGVGLLAFPECLMGEYDTEAGRFEVEPEPIDGPFATAINAMAREFGIWCIYTMNERPLHMGSDVNPYNTAMLVDSSGALCGTYRKVHLFKSDFTDESERIAPGDKYFEPVDTPFGKLGIAICYDLRFPDQAAAAASQGCDLLIYPSAWFAGKTKEAQWRTLLGARAIENKMVVAGLSRADERYIGQSCVMGPLGQTLASAGPEPCLLTCRLQAPQAS